MLDAAHALHRLGNHPNLVQFYRWATSPEGHECLVMEYVHTGSLRKAFENPGLSFTARSKLAVCEQICSAMCELSQEKVMHGGLSANNVLIVSMEPVHIKVANHGLLRLRKEEVKPNEGPSTISPCTSDREHWKAPEVMADNGSEWS
ncbi:hypothetical protein CEUSTIGMA_g6534.t1 [Chlamydomonas eustigma]|uniref:Protein kinase domain-containing protein n=1 Tax=Chlamydomonas eustigma TaxID=1157962 RepID=A0A250X7N1_9CHLO|nr:hypothetical protein CEUSTIGMA_g6534.t1 [Chlamydomonas eustigma]|eukprot:GAX79094.1 hypothetical protein CEUSTIGMA_g6534.t1 [Chlamydomonas eustigma]